MDRTLQTRKRFLIPVAISLVSTLGVFVLLSVFHGIFQDWEDRTVDIRFQLRGTIPSDPRIVLIDIDDRSLQEIGRWPWDRTRHARMIKILSESGASVIGYDVLFSQPAGKTEDGALAEATRKAGNVIYPVGFELTPGTGLLAVHRAVTPLPDLIAASAGIGHVSSNRDPDGSIRRVPLLVRQQEETHPAFGLLLFTRFRSEEGRPTALKFDPANGVTAGDTKIPTDDQGMIRINYAGPWGETFRHFPFVDILSAAGTEEGRRNLKESLEGAMVIVSNTATGYDLKPVPVQKAYPGGGIHANILNTLLAGNYLREPSGAGKGGLIFLAALPAAGLGLWRRWGWGLALTGGLVIGYGFLSVGSFSAIGWILPILGPVGGMGLAYMGGLLYQLRATKGRLAAVQSEKDLAGESLRRITHRLQEHEERFYQVQGELSRLLIEMDQTRQETDEKRSRIRELEESIERERLLREDLDREKRKLEQQVAELLMEPVGAGEVLAPDLTALSQECARHGIICRNPEMLRVFEMARKAAGTRSAVLLLGETGTGKELFARAIHALSPRREAPFVTVNIPAIPDNLIESELFGHIKGAFTGAVSDKKGRFEIAHGGTLFLDEIGEMPLGLQAKLLRVLQSGELDRVGGGPIRRVDVRIVAATHRDLEAGIRAGTFREDLFFRLNVIPLTLLPLRQRTEDIVPLAEFFVRKAALEMKREVQGISPRGMQVLQQHLWRGNVRELENILTRAVILGSGGWITEGDLEGLTRRHEERESLDPQGAGEEEFRGDDETFLDLLRKNRFRIGEASSAIGQSRGTVAARFKGICLEALAREEGDFSRAAKKISGRRDDADFVEARIREYYDNLMDVAKGYTAGNDAIEECRRRYKNIPQRYLPGMERLVKQYFEGSGH